MRRLNMACAAVLLAATATTAQAQPLGGGLLGNVLGNGNGSGGLLGTGSRTTAFGGGANLSLDAVGDLILLSPVPLGNLTGALGSLDGLLSTLDGGAGELGTLPGLEGLLDGVADFPVPADALGNLILLSPVQLGELTGALGSLDGLLVLVQQTDLSNLSTLPGVEGLLDGIADMPVPTDALGNLILLSPVQLGELTGALGSLDGVLVLLQGSGRFGTLPGLNGLGE